MIFRKAILIIHGIAGGTYDQEYLAHRLELNRTYDVYTFTLAGHDGLFTGNMDEKSWIKSAEDMMTFLREKGYKKIYVIGHSMGGVIATKLANKYKEIKKIVLIAASFRYLAYKNGEFDLIKLIKKSKEVFGEYSGNEVITRLIKMPIPVLKEFSNIVNNNQNNLKKIYIPTLIIQGNKDSLVPLETADYIYNSIPTKDKNILIYNGVSHDVFRSSKKDEITNEIIKFLKK